MFLASAVAVETGLASLTRAERIGQINEDLVDERSTALNAVILLILVHLSDPSSIVSLASRCSSLSRNASTDRLDHPIAERVDLVQ